MLVGTIPISLFEDTLTISAPNGFAELLSGLLAKRQVALENHLSPTSSLEIVLGG